ncbi:MAG: hypothetical protein PF636_04605 [Actinomycetota bacterium]|jgi:hypothetical protein|nr:hypothetical protein [Actinomycetota bacterium]
MDRIERLRSVIADMQGHQMCAPDDDPIRLDAVAVGYSYLLTQLKRLTKALVSPELAADIDGVSVDVQNIYSVYEARAQIDALLPEVEDAIAQASQRQLTFEERIVEGLRQLLHAKGRDDLVAKLSRCKADFDVSSQYGSYWNSYSTEAVFRAPIEDCEVLRVVPEEDQNLLISLLRELNPPREGDMDISSLSFVVDPARPTLIELTDLGLSTGWDRVDRGMLEIRDRLSTAGTEEQYQAIGHGCREVLISLAQAVYDPELHPPVDEVKPSKADAKRMLEAYLEHELAGASNKEMRKYARAALDVANNLQHDRTATYRDAILCAEATASVVGMVAIVSGKRAKGSC